LERLFIASVFLQLGLHLFSVIHNSLLLFIDFGRSCSFYYLCCTKAPNISLIIIVVITKHL